MERKWVAEPLHGWICFSRHFSDEINKFRFDFFTVMSRYLTNFCLASKEERILRWRTVEDGAPKLSVFSIQNKHKSQSQKTKIQRFPQVLFDFLLWKWSTTVASIQSQVRDYFGFHHSLRIGRFGGQILGCQWHFWCEITAVSVSDISLLRAMTLSTAVMSRKLVRLWCEVISEIQPCSCFVRRDDSSASRQWRTDGVFNNSCNNIIFQSWIQIQWSNHWHWLSAKANDSSLWESGTRSSCLHCVGPSSTAPVSDHP